MNAKDKASLAVAGSVALAAVPYVVVAVGVAYVGAKFINWLFSDGGEKKAVPAADPASDSGVHTVLSSWVSGEEKQIPANSAGNPVPKATIPAHSTPNPTISNVPARNPVPIPVIPSASVSAPVALRPVSPSSVVPASIPAPKPALIPVSAHMLVAKPPEFPIPPPRKFITRDDMAMVFRVGHGLSRKQAVAELKKLGFGKSAAYEALSASGRFSTWLRTSSDGMIAWGKSTEKL